MKPSRSSLCLKLVVKKKNVFGSLILPTLCDLALLASFIDSCFACFDVFQHNFLFIVCFCPQLLSLIKSLPFSVFRKHRLCNVHVSVIMPTPLLAHASYPCTKEEDYAYQTLKAFLFDVMDNNYVSSVNIDQIKKKSFACALLDLSL